MARTVFIGDVHGCLDELDALLAKLKPGAGDSWVFVGDLINKGPDSAGVVKRVRELGARSVLGNHEAAALRRRMLPADELKPHHRRLLESFSDGDWKFLRALPTFLRLPELNVLVVHGGLVPGIPVEKQAPELLCNLRSITVEGEPSKRIDEGRPWASVWKGPERVVFGHDARRGLQRHPFALGLDSGCVYGGALTTHVLPDDTLVSVKARKAYVKLGD